jgi:DNA-binding transcriptional regulator YdaS (Cro superfamily)
MDMRAYLNSIKTEDREQLATRCGTSVNYFWQIAGKHRNPSHSLAQKIEKFTDGKVTCQDLRPDIYGHPNQGNAA